MGRRPGALVVGAALIATSLGLAACGGRFSLPGAKVASHQRHPTQAASIAGAPVAPTGTTGPAGEAVTTPTPTAPPSPAASPPATGSKQGAAASPSQEAEHAYESYLTDLSGLDDTLSKSYLAPLASVTTDRLAQATVRQAASILSAKEHGVGTLRDDHVAIVMTGPASAALADCQDEEHFMLVSDGSGTPDSFVARGYFVGSAQLVLQDGSWLVDTFTTTHEPCTF